jgi:hypothetical protein
MQKVRRWWRELSGRAEIERLQLRQLRVLELLVDYARGMNAKMDQIISAQRLAMYSEEEPAAPTVDEIMARVGSSVERRLPEMTESVADEAARSVERYENDDRVR